MAKMKYGVIFGADALGVPALREFKASTTLPAQSGRFVVRDTSDGYIRAVATDEDYITGYCEDILAGSNAAADTFPVFMNLEGVTFEVPYATAGAAATLTDAVGKTLMGKNIDVAVVSNVQYGNASSTTDGLFLVVGYNVEENTLYVQVKNAKRNLTA